MSHSLSSSGTNSSLKASTSTMGEMANGLENGSAHSHFAITLVQECSATKKGLLWEQQQNRFFFNRWKERFFILTTDYLTCFKKGSKKVGMSEMGSFVYKINLNEVKALTWVDKKKNGVIGVQLANTVIFLWIDSERQLDDWMMSLQESTNRTKCRREALRKSATLLPTLLTSSPSRLSSKDFNLIERNNSPNLFMHRSNTPNLCDQDHLGADIVPPPPPPRRYLRCLSTDIDKIATLGDKKLMTSSPRSKPVHSSVHNTFHKLGTDFEGRKLSASGAGLGPATQSLRCKSSYALQLSPLLLANSPTLMQQQQQRRATAKRMSSASQNARPQSQAVFPCDSLQSADSEFSFIPSKSISLKSSLVADSFRTAPKGATAHLLTPSPRSMLTSSASLVLNSRRKQWTGDDRKLFETPPPIPPHRTHLHHF